MSQRTIPTTLGQRMADGVVWVVGARLLVRLLGVISMVILARLLQPSDYGLIALATAFAAAVELLGAFNFELWLVRHPAPTRAHYDTVWTLSLLRSVVIATALWLSADAVAALFAEPALVQVLHVLALGTLLAALTNVGIVDFQRDLRFDREFVYLGLAKFGSFLVAVGMALWWRSYWALLAGIVTDQFLRVVLSYRMQRHRPRWSLQHWREVFGFSKWLLVGNIFGFAYQRAGTFILGKLAASEAVGLYTVAREIADLASSEIVAPIRRVMLPGYARMNEDAELLRRGFIDGFALIVLIGMPFAAGIAAAAEPLVATLLGPKWSAAVDMVRVLGVYAMGSILMANQGPILLALGHSRLLTMLMASGVAMLVPAFFWAYQRDGVHGAVVATSAVNTALFAISVSVTLRVIGVAPMALLRGIWRALVGTAAMAALMVQIAQALGARGTSPLLTLLACAAAGATAYVGVVGALWLAGGRVAGPEQTALDYLGQRLQRRKASG